MVPDSGHEVSVCPTAVAETLEALSAFDFKAKFFVKMDSCRVVAVDFQFDAREIEPIVGHIHQFCHEPAANSQAPIIGMDSHAQSTAMLTARVLAGGEGGAADDMVVYFGDKTVSKAGAIAESLDGIAVFQTGDL
jgi:hypothetical protein